MSNSAATSFQTDPQLSVSSYLSLFAFLVSTIFVIRPVRIPISRRRKWYFPLGMTTSPILATLFLLATTSIHPNVVLSGLVGIPSLHPYSILILFYSIAYICISLDQTGFLQFTAFWVLRRTGSNGRVIFVSFVSLITLVSALTSNDAVILTATGFLIHFTAEAKIDPPSAFLVSEFVAANIASMFLYIGNPTNVVIAQANSVTFMQYSAWMALPSLACIVLAYLILRYILFSTEKYIPFVINVNVNSINPTSALKDPKGSIFGIVLLSACLITLTATSFYDIPVWEVTLPFACVSLARDIWYDLWGESKKKEKKDEEIASRITQEYKVELDDGLDDGLGEALKEKDFEEKEWGETCLEDTGPGKENEGGNAEVKEGDHFGEEEGRENGAEVISTTLPLAKHVPQKSDMLANSFTNPRQMPQNEQSKSRNILARHLPTVQGALLRLPWSILPFSLGMFILVESLTATDWTAVLAKGLGYLAPSFVPAIFSMGVISFVLCSFLNNIPATILLIRVLLHPAFANAVSAHASMGSPEFKAVMTGSMYALVAGSNLGACLTIAASLAGIMWEKILNDAGLGVIGPWKFFLWNLAIGPVLITGACLVLCAEVYVIFLGRG